MSTEIPARSRGDIDACIKAALDEDVGAGDVTTNSVIRSDSRTSAEIVAKQQGVIAGLDVAARVFSAVDSSIQFRALVIEGSLVESGTVVAIIEGPVKSILTAERTALNFLGRMSGIATLTQQFTDAVAGTPAKILDTRKTAPGLRIIDKLAVVRGGGHNHRYGLFDMILIKDNHIAAAGGLREAVRLAREAANGLEIEVEASTLDDVASAIESGAERILLDNMTPRQMRDAVKLTNKRAKLEASGNVSLSNVREIAETGVDYISVGALTHSPKVFDVSLQFEPGK